MRYITLTCKRFSVRKRRKVVVDDSDYAVLKRIRWHRIAGCKTDYASMWAKGRNTSMHSLIMKPPKGFIVDHINGNGLDNRRKNLEIVTHSENVKRGRKCY